MIGQLVLFGANGCKKGNRHSLLFGSSGTKLLTFLFSPSGSTTPEVYVNLVTAGRRVKSLDVDARLGLVYWTDNMEAKIYRYKQRKTEMIQDVCGWLGRCLGSDWERVVAAKTTGKNFKNTIKITQQCIVHGPQATETSHTIPARNFRPSHLENAQPYQQNNTSACAVSSSFFSDAFIDDVDKKTNQTCLTDFLQQNSFCLIWICLDQMIWSNL